MPARRDIPVPELAEERTAAMRQVYAQVRKREAQRRALSDAIRAELRAVKELSPVAPASIREAARINRMAPERRIKWEAKLNGALGLLGYSQIVLTDNPVSARSNSAAAARQTIERLEAERREIGDEIAGYYRAAAEKELDVSELRLFVRMGRHSDAIEMGEWFDRVDNVGKTLGVWDGSASEWSEGDADE